MTRDHLTERLANLSPVKRALLKLRLEEKGTILPVEQQTIPRRSTPGSSAAPCARVSVTRADDRVRLEVVDSANGIPPERLRTLFQPFQSGEAGGFGIGLYESKRIVESYRGTLRLESEVGRGTRVVVELPAIGSARSSVNVRRQSAAVPLVVATNTI